MGLLLGSSHGSLLICSGRISLCCGIGQYLSALFLPVLPDLTQACSILADFRTNHLDKQLEILSCLDWNILFLSFRLFFLNSSYLHYHPEVYLAPVLGTLYFPTGCFIKNAFISLLIQLYILITKSGVKVTSGLQEN